MVKTITCPVHSIQAFTEHILPYEKNLHWFTLKMIFVGNADSVLVTISLQKLVDTLCVGLAQFYIDREILNRPQVIIYFISIYCIILKVVFYFLIPSSSKS